MFRQYYSDYIERSGVERYDIPKVQIFQYGVNSLVWVGMIGVCFKHRPVLRGFNKLMNYHPTYNAWATRCSNTVTNVREKIPYVKSTISNFASAVNKVNFIDISSAKTTIRINASRCMDYIKGSSVPKQITDASMPAQVSATGTSTGPTMGSDRHILRRLMRYVTIRNIFKTGTAVIEGNILYALTFPLVFPLTLHMCMIPYKNKDHESKKHSDEHKDKKDQQLQHHEKQN